MENCLEILQNELADYVSKTGLSDAPSILELLWQNYQQKNSIDDGLIKEREDALTPVFRELSIVSSDILSDLIADLCTAYQRAALLEGIYIGAQMGMLANKEGAPHD